MTGSAWVVFEYWLVRYRRSWRGTVLSAFLLPVLFFLGIGVSVGSYVDSSGVLGVRYLDYIGPGLLASTALQVAMGESSWPVLAALRWTRSYHAMRATPVGLRAILAGHIGYALLRVALASVGFLVVMTGFGAVHSLLGLAVLPVALLVGLATAAPVFSYAATISNDSMFAVLYRFAVIPMTLFAGVFFPVASMPLAARILAYASPLWHGVELCRAATLGTPTAWGAWVHLGYLLAWCVAGYALATWRFHRRLAD